MFSIVVPLLMEFFKYKSGQALREKFQMTQEQIQKAVQEQITKILIKFFGGLICTVALCYSMVGLFDLVQVYINSLMYATEIKIAFYILISGASAWGFFKIFKDNALSKTTPTEAAPPLQPQNDLGPVQSLLTQFLEGLNQGLKEGQSKKTHQNNI